MKNKLLITLVVIALALLIWPVVGNLSKNNDKITGKATLDSSKQELTFYRSQSCGCCGIYKGYLESKSDFNVNDVVIEDTQSIKKEKGIPLELQSCHTSIIGKYFIEGHVPLEAINKLLSEQPDIKGLAIAGMPSGAPGMPGSKKAPFIIYAVNNDGSSEEYMTL